MSTKDTSDPQVHGSNPITLSGGPTYTYAHCDVHSSNFSNTKSYDSPQRIAHKSLNKVILLGITSNSLGTILSLGLSYL